MKYVAGPIPIKYTLYAYTSLDMSSTIWKEDTHDDLSLSGIVIREITCYMQLVDGELR